MGKQDPDTLPLVKGTLDLLILKAVSGAPMHGYGIAKWLEENSAGALEIEDSAIYQALHRLEGRRFIQAEWARTENNRRARYYTLTAPGREHLAREVDVWRRYTESVSSILALDAPAG